MFPMALLLKYVLIASFRNLMEKEKECVELVGKIKLPQFGEPSQLLKTLLAEDTKESKHVLSNIRKHISCFQMTSLGIEIVTAHSRQLSNRKSKFFIKPAPSATIPKW
ncbi:hypothetical protein NPIL_345601 [Nephila pilipes]|uniref:Uncharacterized protein n=1 Tax=Nephila pilipes TaxID=299642 RepID=A0A8X6NUL3_NEPPI|nr:hypothetical protein NPIL_345601 [Nephila pilipes]